MGRTKPVKNVSVMASAAPPSKSPMMFGKMGIYMPDGVQANTQRSQFILKISHRRVPSQPLWATSSTNNLWKSVLLSYACVYNLKSDNISLQTTCLFKNNPGTLFLYIFETVKMIWV